MKFSIQEEGGEKQFFLSFQDAEKKTGISSLTIVRIMKSDKGYFRRRSDKKVIFIRKDNDEPFIQIDGEDYHSFEEIHERFGLKRPVFYKQLLKQGGKYFLDDQGEIHKVTKKSELLTNLISDSQNLEMHAKVMAFKKHCKKMPAGFPKDDLLRDD